MSSARSASVNLWVCDITLTDLKSKIAIGYIISAVTCRLAFRIASNIAIDTHCGGVGTADAGSISLYERFPTRSAMTIPQDEFCFFNVC